jgi:hypothetical protein
MIAAGGCYVHGVGFLERVKVTSSQSFLVAMRQNRKWRQAIFFLGLARGYQARIFSCLVNA